MRLKYDASVDAAYLYLVEIPPGGVDKTIECESLPGVGTVNLDFDSSGRLVGLEITRASSMLPVEALKGAE